MTTLVREPDSLPRLFAETMLRRMTGYYDYPAGPQPAAVQAEVYDELDRRLMATFPASDATAIY